MICGISLDTTIQMYYGVIHQVIYLITKYIQPELRKNNITIRDADFVLRLPITVWTDISPSRRGNDRLMFTGFDSSGRLLEIAVEYFDDEDIELVFHGDKATTKYRKLFERIKA